MRRLLRSPEALLALLVLSACLLVADGVIDNIDTRVCFRSAQSLLSDGTLALQDPTPLEREGLWTAQGVDGRWYSKFGVGETVLLVPFVAAGRFAALFLPWRSGELEEFLVALSSAVLLAATAPFLFRICRDHLRTSAAAAAVGTLGWIFGTFQLSYAGSTYLETPLACAVVMSAWAALRSREPGKVSHALLAGAFAAVVVSIKVAMVVYVPFLLLPLFTRDRTDTRRRLAGAGIPLAVGAGLLFTANHLRFGHPLRTGYVEFGTLFETPLLVGLRAYVFDPDLSLPLFAPAFVLALFGLPALGRRSQALAVAALGVLVSGTLLHAVHTGYHGGTAYGPRYLVSAIALLTAPGLALLHDAARTAGRRRAFLALLAVCVLVQIPSALVSPLEYHTLRGHLRQAGRPMDALPPRLVTDVRLLRLKASGATSRYDLRALIDAPADVPAEPVYEVPRMDRGPAVWWVLASREKTRAALLAGAALAAAAAASAWFLARSLRAAPQ